MTHVTYRLTAKNRDQLWNPTLGNRVWATFFILGRDRSPTFILNRAPSFFTLARVWSGGVTVRVFARDIKGRGFDSRPYQVHATTLGKLFTHTCASVTTHTHTHTHTRLTALCPALPGRAGTRKVKPIWILLKQETVSGNGISWAICKSAPRCRQITMPAPHHSGFYRPDALPAAQPTVSKH